MDVALYISGRLRLNVGGGRRTPSVVIAVAGIAIAVVVMTLTIAIVTGFKSQISDKVMGFDSQITLTALSPPYSAGQVYTELSSAVGSLIDETVPDGAVSSLSIRRPAVLKTEDAFEAVAFEGNSQGYDWNFVRDNIVDGTVLDFEGKDAVNDIVLSSYTASRLGLNAGDRVDAFFFDGERLKLRKLNVAGVYNTNFVEYDSKIAFSSLTMLQRVSGLSPEQGTSIRIGGLERDDIEPLTRRLNDRLSAAYHNQEISGYYVAQSVYRSQPTYFGWLELLDTNVVVILILMACVSGFTLISCLFILILERVRLIGVLKALGAGNAVIRRIFMYMGARVILAGVIIGDAVAWLLLWLQSSYHLMKLDATAYCLSYVPVEMSPVTAVLLNVAVVLLAMLLLFIPAQIIAGISPSQTIRYE